MEERPLVSVVIPAYNAERFLCEAVDSALAQTYQPLEVVVVNDGSTDGTAALIERYGPRIVGVQLPRNQGLPTARNEGIRHSKGGWVGFLDADDYWEPQMVETLIAAAQVGDAVLYCNVKYVDLDKRPTGGFDRPRALGRSPSLADMLVSNDLPIMATLVRREALTAVGCFDPDTRYGEDYQFALCLAAAGLHFRHTDAFLAYQRKHGGSMSRHHSRMTDGLIRALTQARARYPKAFGRTELRLYRRKLAVLYYDRAYQHSLAGNRLKSVCCLCRSVLCSPWYALGRRRK